MFVPVSSVSPAEERAVITFAFDSDQALDAFACDKAAWRAQDGKLYTAAGSGSAFLTYEIPAAYRGMDFDVDVDFIGHTATGSILIGGAFDGMPAKPKDFFGYDCLISASGTRAALGCYDENGVWKDIIFHGQDYIDTADLHLSVAVRGDKFFYRVFSLDKKTQYFGITYKIADSGKDVCTSLDGKIGLRKFFSDKGAFANLTLTFYPDVLPDALKDAAPMDFALSCDVSAKKRTFVFFGMRDRENGYAVVLNKPYNVIGLYAVQAGKYQFLAEKKCPVFEEKRKLKISVDCKVARVYYQDNTLVEFDGDYPKIDLPLDDYAAGKIGFAAADGEIADVEIKEEMLRDVAGYQNPVCVGADPDVLFYDGVYYMYNRISAGNEIFRVSISTDLVHWTPKNTVFTKEDSYTAYGYMSPNVFYHDGIFYLFYAAHIENWVQRLYCATSTSPYGPFTHKHGQVPLHNAAEIGGHPFMDDDGRFFLTYVRFGKGNAIWIEEGRLRDGKVSFVEGTLRELIVPRYENEIDGKGRCCEGGVIRKHNGYYYMIYATTVYNSDYGESYAVADNVLGPYRRYAHNDILSSNAKIRGVGDGIFVASPDGKDLFMIYHCHKDMQTVEPRNTCIDRVRFVPNPNGGPDILQFYGPTVSTQPMPLGGK